MNCYDECKIKKRCCEVKECRLWIDFPKDLNCTEIAVQKNGEMILKKVAERLHLTASRIKQIESKALIKVSKSFQKLNIL